VPFGRASLFDAADCKSDNGNQKDGIKLKVILPPQTLPKLRKHSAIGNQRSQCDYAPLRRSQMWAEGHTYSRYEAVNASAEIVK